MVLQNILILLISSNLLYDVRGNSIAFVIDNTFSMKNSISEVRSTVTQISDVYSNYMFIDKYIIVKFNDIEHLTNSKVYDNRYLFDVALNLINATEVNLDCPEPALYGVIQALKRISELKSNIYVFTDAPAKDYYRQREIIKLCQDSKSQITFIVLGQCMKDPKQFWMYNAIAKNCSGNVFVISKDELNQVPIYVRETIKGNPKVLMRTELPPHQPTDLKFNITHKTDYVIVSVSGRNVHMLSRALSQERIMWTDNFKALKILYPSFGEHVVLISGESIGIAVNILTVDKGYNWLNETTSKTTVKVTELSLMEIAENIPIESVTFATIQSKESTSINPTESTSLQPPEELTLPRIEISEGKKVEIQLGYTNILTCKVTGNPEPKIIWTDGNENILPSRVTTFYAPYLYISFLNISNVIENSFYACKASNIVGYSTKYIEVTLKDRPLVAFNNSKDQNPIIDLHGQDENIVVDSYTHTDVPDTLASLNTLRIVEQTVNWCESEKLYCSGVSEPYTKYEWLFNGSLTDQTGESLKINNIGNYICRASNLYESVQINFTVIATTCCIVNIGQNVNHYTPFIVNENLIFPEIRGTEKQLMIPSNEKLIFVCHNPYIKISPFHKTYVTVACDHQNIFKIDSDDDHQYGFEDINCDNEVYPVVKRSRLSGEVNIKEVGFILNKILITVYTVYTNEDYFNMSTVVAYNPVITEKNNFHELHWFDHPEVDKENISEVYTCHNVTSVCCYAKRQLVSANDVTYGAAQTSTFVNNLNSVPYWRTCYGSSETALDYFEQSIKSIYEQNTTVWSGASNYITNDGIGRAPAFLWKVIKVNDTECLSYLYVNVEDTDSYFIKCTYSSYINMIPDELKGRLYVCTEAELAEIIGVRLLTFA